MPDLEKVEAELRAGLEKATQDWQSRHYMHLPSSVVQANDEFNDLCSPENIRLLLDELSRLREVEKRYREALAVFAAQADRYDPPEDDDNVGIWGGTSITLGYLRAARRALQGGGDNG